ncbi:MAG: SOS response-associated peptidase family protein [Sphingomonadaceae bacterium]
MCNLYRLTTTVEAIRDLFRAMEGDSPNLPLLAEFYPARPAPVVVEQGEGRALVRMTWGVPPPPGVARPVTNIRNLESPFWRPMLSGTQRCLVPVSAFAEWSAAPDPSTGRKRKHWFALRSAPLFAFAGLFRRADEGWRFAFLTCPPNRMVGAVHPGAMPVILSGDSADQWLSGVEARLLQRPWLDADMVELADGTSDGLAQPRPIG